MFFPSAFNKRRGTPNLGSTALFIIELNLLGCSCEHYVLTASGERRSRDTGGRRNRSHGVPSSHVSMVTLKVASCFSFSFVCSTGGKGHVLLSVISKAVVLLFPIVSGHLMGEL